MANQEQYKMNGLKKGTLEKKDSPQRTPLTQSRRSSQIAYKISGASRMTPEPISKAKALSSHKPHNLSSQLVNKEQPNLRSILLKFTTPLNNDLNVRQSSDIKETEEDIHQSKPIYQMTRPFHPKSAGNIMMSANPYQEQTAAKKSYQRFLSTSSERSTHIAKSNSSMTERIFHRPQAPLIEESKKVETAQMLKPKGGATREVSKFEAQISPEDNLEALAETKIQDQMVKVRELLDLDHQQNVEKNKMQVLIRVRPFLPNEDQNEAIQCISSQELSLKRDFQSISYKFDKVLPQNTSQDQVFDHVRGLINSFTLGVNCTIFAYGQTGAGKTYSILGCQDNFMQRRKYPHLGFSEKDGILPRSLLHLLQNKEVSVKYQASFFEIYNEKVYDLLDEGQPPVVKRRSLSRGETSASFGVGGSVYLKAQQTEHQRVQLQVKESPDGNFYVAGLKYVDIDSYEQAHKLLNKGLQRRSTNSTLHNEKSSRSHSVFQLNMQSMRNGTSVKASLRIVDLAGSERFIIKKEISAEEKKLKLEELKNINLSLTQLGLCISALTEQSVRKHIPYRNCKLTKVLKDSLDENSNVALIVCLSPSMTSSEETISTLQFAKSAKRALLIDQRSLKSLFHQVMPDEHISYANSEESSSQIPIQLTEKLNQLPSVNPSHQASSSQMQTAMLLKAYEEEKAIRVGLQRYLQQEVEPELVKLKSENIQMATKLRDFIHSSQDSQRQNQESGIINNRDNTIDYNGERVISINIIPKQQIVTLMGKSRHFSKNKKKASKKPSGKPSLTAKPQESQKALVEQQPAGKRVRFAEKLDNDSSLDSSMRERIEHNLKYNDDTIFDGISIFQDLNSSGMTVHLKKVKEKEKYPAKQLILDNEEEDEDSDAIVEQVPSKLSEEQKQDAQGLGDQSGGVVGNLMGDGLSGEQDSWVAQDPMKAPLILCSFIDKIEDEAGDKSVEFSRDLIDLGNDPALLNISTQNRQFSQQQRDRSPFQYEKVNKPQGRESSILEISNIVDRKSQNDSNPLKVSFDQSQIPFMENRLNQSDTDEKMLFEPENNEEFLPSQSRIMANDSFVGENSIILIEEAPHNPEENNPHLYFEGQSLLLESGTLNAGQVDSFMQDENSSRVQPRNETSGERSMKVVQDFDESGILPKNNQLNSSVKHTNLLSPLPSSQNQNANEDLLLTYSHSNTLTTLRSLHEELNFLRSMNSQNLFQSDKKDATVMQKIHQYAREIEKEGVDDQFTATEDAKKAIQKENDSNQKLLKGVRGFYAQISNEIQELRRILQQSNVAQKHQNGMIDLNEAQNIIRTITTDVRAEEPIKMQKAKELLGLMEHLQETLGGLSQTSSRFEDPSSPDLGFKRFLAGQDEPKQELQSHAYQTIDEDVDMQEDHGIKGRNPILYEPAASLNSAASPQQALVSGQGTQYYQLINGVPTLMGGGQGHSRVSSFQHQAFADNHLFNNGKGALNIFAQEEGGSLAKIMREDSEEEEEPVIRANMGQHKELQHQRKKTPEIFKGLSSMLDQSSIASKDVSNISIKEEVKQQTKRLNFFINAQNNILGESEQDLLATLKSFNDGNCEKRRESQIDNTLNLIFDTSCEEPLPRGLPIGNQNDQSLDVSLENLREVKLRETISPSPVLFKDDQGLGIDPIEDSSFLAEGGKAILQHDQVQNNADNTSLIQLAEDLIFAGEAPGDQVQENKSETSLTSGGGITSKTSVHKYWNKYFRPPSAAQKKEEKIDHV